MALGALDRLMAAPPPTLATPATPTALIADAVRAVETEEGVDKDGIKEEEGQVDEVEEEALEAELEEVLVVVDVVVVDVVVVVLVLVTRPELQVELMADVV